MAKNDTESQAAELRKRAEAMIGTPEESSKFSREHQDTEEIRHELRYTRPNWRSRTSSSGRPWRSWKNPATATLTCMTLLRLAT